ncbi:MAG: 8-amino-7-oxononanoate synthase [Planctomycetota bacterium]|nr:MAG: 8-amino-7-oxononanoate synthase [Planctomycetota bacterium]REK30888.1 MAG: 8-amino-7-oxononanoate synthase [Planctomycetota bacterium]
MSHSPLDWLADELSSLDAAGLRRRQRVVRSLGGGRCEVDGRTLWDFSSNDYLNLANDPRVIEAARSGSSSHGTGARASALVCGRTEWHERLESRLAAFEGAEAAILFPSGYAANVGTIGALVGEGDVVLCDRLSHACLVDGCRLSGARFRVYPHADVDRLDRELAKHATARRCLIVTDGVFSMDGDLAPLPELCDAAERHAAMLLVDEAHGTGVFGHSGRGAAEELGVENRNLIRTGTLSKAIGAQGGFVTGSRDLIDWLWNGARTQMFSTALTPAMCAAACAALDIIENEPQRREGLAEKSGQLRSQLAANGIEVPPKSRGPIVPVILGDSRRCTEVAARLEEQGFLTGCIRPPTVPRETARLRVSVTAQHPDEVVSALAAAIAEAALKRTAIGD